MLRYCVYRPSYDDKNPMQLEIPENTTYVFRRVETGKTSDGLPRIALKWIDGGSELGGIDQIHCTGYNYHMTVGDLLDAFGAGAAENSDKVGIDIVPLKSLFSPHDEKAKPRKLASIVETANIPGLPQAKPVSQTLQSPQRAQEVRPDLPNFALQLEGTPRAFGGSTISPAQQGVKSGAFLLQLEYQPDFLQHFGIISIGPSVGAYPTLGRTQSNESVTSGVFSLMGVGGQARYQFHYFDNQFLVPYVSYEAQSLSYRIKEGGSGRLTIAGGSGGLSLLLNRLAPGEAADIRNSLGVSRSYFVIEGKYLTGSDENVRVSGTSVYFGLRFER